MSEMVELGMWDSLVKFNEKLTLMLLKVKSQMEIPEEDYDMIKPLCRDIWDGKVTFFKPVLQLTDENVKEQMLFGQNGSQDSNGTDVVL